MPSLLKTSLLLNLLLSSLRQAQKSQSFGLVGSCGNYIEAGIKFFFFPFSAPYNIFFFFFGCIGFLLLHAGFLQVWCTSFPLRGLPLWNMGSRACGLSQPKACGISSDQDSNSCPLHWQEDSQPLAHQGSP